MSDIVIHPMASHQPPHNDASDNSPQPFSPHFPLNELYSSDLVCDQLVAYEEQQNLHLVPCAWEQFLELDSPIHGYYDYIEGLVISCPNMANKEHDELRVHHGTVMIFSRQAAVFQTPSIQILNTQNTPEWTVHGDSDESNPNRASSSAERRAPSPSGLLHPDFAITNSRRESEVSDSSGGTGLAKELVKFAHPYSSKLLVVGEVTSKKTRQVDLRYKWTAYARSGVPMYLILDRGTEKQAKRVIVGSITHFSGAEKSTSADILAPPASRPRRGPAPPTYYRKVYRPQDIVDCPYYSELEMTAAKLLDVKTMRTLAVKLREQERLRAERTETAEREREEAKRKERDERRKREEAEREREEAKREARDERRKRAQLEEEIRKMKSKREEETRQRKAGNERNRETRAVGEGSSRNVERKDKKAPAAKKASAVKEPSSSKSSPKSDSPLHKKSRK